MSESDGAAYIKEAKRELTRLQKNANCFAFEYRKCRARNSDMTKNYKILAMFAVANVRRQKRHIREQLAYQQKHDQLTSRLAELESKLVDKSKSS